MRVRLAVHSVALGAVGAVSIGCDGTKGNCSSAFGEHACNTTVSAPLAKRTEAAHCVCLRPEGTAPRTYEVLAQVPQQMLAQVWPVRVVAQLPTWYGVMSQEACQTQRRLRRLREAGVQGVLCVVQSLWRWSGASASFPRPHKHAPVIIAIP